MNKGIKIIITFVILAIMAAAGFVIYQAVQENVPASLSGKFILVSMTEDGETFDREWIIENGRGDYYFEFFNDGTCITTLWGVTADCTFVQNGKGFTISDEYGNINKTGKIEGRQLIYHEFGDELVFERK